MSIKKALGQVGAVLSVAVAVGLIGCKGGDKGVTPPPPPETYTLTTSANPTDGGNVRRSPNESEYTEGARVTLTAEAKDGYEFTEWAGASTSKDSSITVTVNGDLTFIANFRLKETGGDGDTTGTGDPVVMTDSTVTISGLTWMRQNLNIETDDSWCYDNNPGNCAKYGRLYTWEAAKTACASMGGGWRLPDTADWNKLVNYAGGRDVAGIKLKSETGWSIGTSTDDYGFSALPGGQRRSNGSTVSVGTNGFWWSATEFGSDLAYRRGMTASRDDVGEDTSDKSWGYSVRCVED